MAVEYPCEFGSMGDCKHGNVFSKEGHDCKQNPSKCEVFKRLSILEGEATATEAYANCECYPDRCNGSRINGLKPSCQRTFCPAPADNVPQKCPHCHRPLRTVDPAWQGTHLQCTGCRRGWQRDSKGYYHATGCTEIIVADQDGEVIWEGNNFEEENTCPDKSP